MNEQPCEVCGLGKFAHGTLNHKFSTDGKLVPKEKLKAKPATTTKIDFPLRMLLIQKGIITPDELTGMEAMIRDQLAAAPDSSFGGITSRDS